MSDDLDPGMVRDAIRSGFARVRAALEVAEYAFGQDELELAATAMADVAVASDQFGQVVFPAYAEVSNRAPVDWDQDYIKLLAEALDRRGFPMSYPWNIPMEGFT